MVNAAATEDTSIAAQTSDSRPTQETNEPILADLNNDYIGFGRHDMHLHMRSFGGFRHVEVSEEFELTVTNIAENDTDVKNLINDGYNVTALIPITKTMIDVEGNVITEATTAVLTLQKDTTSHATVMVDIQEAKVTQIIILTRIVIDKS